MIASWQFSRQYLAAAPHSYNGVTYASSWALRIPQTSFAIVPQGSDVHSGSFVSSSHWKIIETCETWHKYSDYCSRLLTDWSMTCTTLPGLQFCLSPFVLCLLLFYSCFPGLTSWLVGLARQPRHSWAQIYRQSWLSSKLSRSLFHHNLPLSRCRPQSKKTWYMTRILYPLSALNNSSNYKESAPPTAWFSRTQIYHPGNSVMYEHIDFRHWTQDCGTEAIEWVGSHRNRRRWWL